MKLLMSILSLTGLVALLGLSLACGGGSSVANTGGISGTGDISKASIENFDLAHNSYGTRSSAKDFTLNSLAPVFVVRFSEEVDILLDEYFAIEYRSGSKVSTTNDFRMIRGADKKTYYIMILKSNRVELGERELTPGTSFEYTFKRKDGSDLIYQGQSVSSLIGNWETKTLTISYPVDQGSSDSQVSLGIAPYEGLSTLTPEFIVHSKYPLENYDPAKSNEGFGVVDDISVTLNGRSIFKSGVDNVQIWNASSDSFKFLVLPQAGLLGSSNYEFIVRPNPTLKVIKDGVASPVSNDDLPNSLFIQTKP